MVKSGACQYRRCRRYRFGPWVRKIPGEGNGNTLQDSCLDNFMDREPGGLQSMGSQRVGEDLPAEHASTCVYFLLICLLLVSPQRNRNSTSQRFLSVKIMLTLKS